MRIWEKLEAKHKAKLNLVREFRFYENRRWKSDFAIPEAKILIEIEGGLWRGRHTNPLGYAADCEKYNAAALLGFSVFRIVNIPVKSLNLLSEYYIEFIYEFAIGRLQNTAALKSAA